MTDLCPAVPLNRTGKSPHAACISGCGLAMLLICAALSGCTDSHSDEYVEFSRLEQPSAAGDPVDDSASPAENSNDAPVANTDTDTDSDSDRVAVTEVRVAAMQTTEPARDSAAVSVADVTSIDGSAGDPPAVDEPTDDQPAANKPADTGGADTGDADTGDADNSDADTSDDEPRKGADTSRPAAIRLLIPHRQFRKEGDALRVTFDDIDLLKVLNMDPVPIDAADYFPDWLKKLNGASVRIRGYMRPGYEAEDITEFLFVRDNGECCYGPLPKIYDMIAVRLAEGESTDLIEGTPFDVEGTLRIEPHADEVELYALFFIDNGVILE